MEHLKELRVHKGLTQQEVALVLGCNQTAVGKYERGKLEPNIETLNKLARLFEVTVDYLTGNTDEMGTLIQSTPSDILSEDEKKIAVLV